VERNPKVPLFLSYPTSGEGMLPGLRSLPLGVSAKAFRPGEALFLDEGLSDGTWENLRLRHLQDRRDPVDARTARTIVREYGVFRNSLGVHYEGLGDDLRSRVTSRSKPQELLAASAQYERSHRHFLWAQEWAPDVPEHPFNVGNALYNLGRMAEAIPWYEKALALKPDYLDAHFNAGVAAYRTGQYRRARDFFEKVLSLNPDHTQARHGVDYILQQGLAVKEDHHRSHGH
jgi:tetratricopeptide (TPR) repeat protein